MTIQDQIAQFLHTQEKSSFKEDLELLNKGKTPKTHSLQELKEWVETQIVESQKGLTQENIPERLAIHTGFCKIRDTYFPDTPLFEEEGDKPQLNIFGE